MSRCLIASTLTAVLCLTACTSPGDRGGRGSPLASPSTMVAIPPAAELLRQIATQDKASDSTSEMRLVIESGEGNGEQIDFRLRRRYAPEAVSTLLEVTAPREETDKALLSIEKPQAATEAFSYLAGLKKLARLSSMSTLTLRGTKITIQELLWLELSQYEAGPGERVDEGGVSLVRYELSAPLERNLAFPRIVAIFRESDMTPARFELFGEGDKLQKTVRIEEVRTIDSHLAMTRIAIEDHIQNRQLRLSTSSVKFNTGLPAKLFTESNLISITSASSQRLLGGN